MEYTSAGGYGTMATGMAGFTPTFGTNGYDAETMYSFIFGGANELAARSKQGYYNNLDCQIEITDSEKTITSRFRWTGEQIDIFPEGYIERVLYYNGFAIAYVDEMVGFTVLPATVNGLNYFFEPSSFSIIANGFNRCVNATDCVMIRENPAAKPLYPHIQRQAMIIADANRAIQTYIQNMKLMTLYVTDDKSQLSASAIARAKYYNEPFLVIERAIQGKKAKKNEKVPFEQFNQQPFVEQLLNEHNSADLLGLINAWKTLFNTMLSKQGINTNMLNKSQYRSEMELEGDTSHVELILQQADNCRQKAVKDIRKMFSIDLTCENVYAKKAEEAAKNNGSVGNEEFNEGNSE